MSDIRVRRRRKATVTAAAVVLLLSACAPSEPRQPATSSTSIAASPTTSNAAAPITTTTASVTSAEDPPCATGDLAFIPSGQIAEFSASGGDAAGISGLRWSEDPRCERFVVDFSTANGSPASSLGSATVDFSRDIGVIRIGLPEEVLDTILTDALIDSPMMDRLYVVRRLDGTLAVDIHVDAPDGAAVRGFLVTSPIRIVVDLEPDGGAAVHPPIVSERLVVTAPQSGPTAYPLTITGYARTNEGAVIARLPLVGESRPEVTATAADWVTTWGEFTMTIPVGPPGAIDLEVGEESARDGTFQGVTISIVAPTLDQ